MEDNNKVTKYFEFNGRLTREPCALGAVDKSDARSGFKLNVINCNASVDDSLPGATTRVRSIPREYDDFTQRVMLPTMGTKNFSIKGMTGGGTQFQFDVEPSNKDVYVKFDGVRINDFIIDNELEGDGAARNLGLCILGPDGNPWKLGESNLVLKGPVPNGTVCTFFCSYIATDNRVTAGEISALAECVITYSD